MEENNVNYPRNHYINVINKLYKFYFEDNIKQYILYLSSICIFVIYAIINSLVFKRNDNSVIFESMAVSTFILVVFPVVYIKHSKIEDNNVIDITWKTVQQKQRVKFRIESDDRFYSTTIHMVA